MRNHAWSWACSDQSGRYQDVVILVCEDFGETVGASVGLTIAFAVVFALAELFNRLLSVSYQR